MATVYALIRSDEVIIITLTDDLILTDDVIST
jgi:hypothetical protein